MLVIGKHHSCIKNVSKKNVRLFFLRVNPLIWWLIIFLQTISNKSSELPSMKYLQYIHRSLYGCRKYISIVKKIFIIWSERKKCLRRPFCRFYVIIVRLNKLYNFKLWKCKALNFLSFNCKLLSMNNLILEANVPGFAPTDRTPSHLAGEWPETVCTIFQHWRTLPPSY